MKNPGTRRGLAWGAIAVASGLSLASPAARAQDSADSVLARAERAMGSDKVKTLRFAGSGTGGTFGQALVPGGPWPKLTISNLSRTLDYPNAALREESARSRAEPAGGGAVPLMGTGEQRQVNLLHGGHAWNLAGTSAVASPVALEARQHDLWTSPHGVLMSARRNRATVTFDSSGGRSLAAVAFTEPGLMRAVAFIDEDGLVERVEARHPHPVTGDTLVVTRYGGYRDHGGVKFPSRISQSHLGSPTLDLEVKEVQVNPVVDIVAPDGVKAFAEKVVAEKVADGVWYLAGGSHHSVLVEMKDHLVIVESPLYDGRASAMLAEAARLVPGKPLRTVVNSHHHFDHSGGLRTAAAAGVTLMVSAPARPYFAKVLANPNRIRPDAFAKSGRRAKLASWRDRTVLTDGSRTIEIHAIDDSLHARGFTMVYLPKEKLLIEADAFTPGAPNAPPPARPNDNHVNLVDNVERRRLAVDRVLPLHGRIVPWSDVLAAIGRKS